MKKTIVVVLILIVVGAIGWGEFKKYFPDSVDNISASVDNVSATLER